MHLSTGLLSGLFSSTVLLFLSRYTDSVPLRNSNVFNSVQIGVELASTQTFQKGGLFYMEWFVFDNYLHISVILTLKLPFPLHHGAFMFAFKSDG